MRRWHDDPDRTLAELAATQHGVFTLDDARVGRAQRRPDRRSDRAARGSRLHDGVFRVAGAPSTWRGDLLAATLGRRRPALQSRIVPRLRSTSLPGGRDDLVELTCVRWKRTIQPGLVVHESRRLDPRDIRLVDGIPVTTSRAPAPRSRALATRTPNYLELVIQAARRKRLITYESTQGDLRPPCSSRTQGRARAPRGRSNAGIRRAAPTDSEMETLLLQALREHGLPEPVLQYEVRDAPAASSLEPTRPTRAPDRDRVRQHARALGRVPARPRRRATQRTADGRLRRSSALGMRDLLAAAAELCDQITADHAPQHCRTGVSWAPYAASLTPVRSSVG